MQHMHIQQVVLHDIDIDAGSTIVYCANWQLLELQFQP